MKTKYSLFLAVGILSILISLIFVSAQISLSTPETLSKSKNSTLLTITNPSSTNTSYNITVTSPVNMVITKTDGTTTNLPISVNQSTLTLANGSSATLNFSYSSLPSSIAFNSYSVQVPISYQAGNTTNSTNATLSFLASYCDYGPLSTSLEITRIRDEQLDNEDEWKWHPLDDIEVDVRITNRGTSDLEVTIESGLYYPSTRQFIDLDEESQDISIEDGESEEVTLKFRIPADTEGSSSYRFYVKAYKEGYENTICTDKKETSYYQTVEVIKKSNSVVFDNINLASSAMCNEDVTLSSKVYNTGNNDEKSALLTLYNKELGINLKKVITNFDSGEDSSLSFNFKIPQNATEKTYTLELKSYFKYDEDNSGCTNKEDTACYDKNSLDDLDKEYKNSLKVEGNCIKPVTTVEKAEVTASLQSEAIAGEEIIVKATVKNAGTSTQTFTLLVSGVETFAVIQKIEPQTFTLEAGKSQDVSLIMNAKDEAKGDYSFTLKAVYGTKTQEQPVSLTIEGSSGIFNKLADSFKDNWFIWVIVAVNIILIVLIIVVITKLA